MLKLQAEAEDSVKAIVAAREHAQANASLKKEVQDLRFRLIMSGSGASGVSADVREEWQQMKDDLTQQLQQAEAQVAELRQQQHNSTAAAESKSADMEADAHAQADATALAHAEHLLSQSQAQIAQLQAERQELQAQIAALQRSSHHVNGVRHPVHAVVMLAQCALPS